MSRPLLILAALVGAALASLGGVDGTAAASGPNNPHGDPAGCVACHAPGESPDKPGAALPIVQTCRSCHPTADMHPVGMAPSHVKVADGWPLENGKVTCATCHAEPAHGGEAAALKAPWHRGGPYPSVTRFCYACHEPEGYERTSPHKVAQITDSRDSSCSACHSGVPVEGAALDQSRLRAGADKVCTGTCHTETAHAGTYEHMGRTVDPAVAAALPATMPLHNGQIACYTCHEVHGDALTPTGSRKAAVSDGLRSRALASDWSALADGAVIWPEADDPHALLAAPTSDSSLCRACHGAGP